MGNFLSVQGMNGQSRHLRGLSGPLTIRIDHGGVGSFGQEEDGYYLAPGWEYPRVEMPPAPGEFITHRRHTEPGEAWKADRTFPSIPMTPSNDERNLPKPGGLPMPALPVRDWPGAFPHGWIPYEDMHAAVAPDAPPMPQGWAPMQRAALERARAADIAGPAPWVAEDAQAYDISGFGSLRGAMSSLGVVAATAEQQATTAVASEAEKAKAAGASPSLVEQIIGFGSSIAAVYLQQRQLEQQKKEQEKLRAAQQAALAAEAAAAGAAPGYRQLVEPTPWYKHPLTLIVGALTAAGGVYLATR